MPRTRSIGTSGTWETPWLERVQMLCSSWGRTAAVARFVVVQDKAGVSGGGCSPVQMCLCVSSGRLDLSWNKLDATPAWFCWKSNDRQSPLNSQLVCLPKELGRYWLDKLH